MLGIRRADTDDFDNVVGCIQDTYGSSYSRQDIYSESQFREKIQSNEWTIFMIEMTEQSEIAGIIGFLQPLFCERVYEFGMHAVKNKYQRLGMGTTLFDYAAKILRENDHPVAYTNVTTIHTAAQKLLEKRTDFICTGFLFTAIHEGIGNPLKETLVFYTLKRRKQKCGTLYIPKELKRAAQFVYSSLGVDYDLQTTELPLYGETIIEHHFDDYANTLYLNINHCGIDLIEKVQSLEQKYNAAPLFSAILYLNIKSCSVAGCNKLIHAGYMFSGFKPLYYEYEYIILCNLKCVRVDLDQIKLTRKSQLMLREVMDIESK